MKFNEFFPNLRDTLTPEVIKTLVEYFEWMFYDSKEFKDINRIYIKDKTFLVVDFKDNRKNMKYPLFGALFGQLFPRLLSEFEIVYSENKTVFLSNKYLREIRDNPQWLYEYYFYNNALPIQTLRDVFSFILYGDDISNYETEEKKEYKYNVDLE